MLLRNLTMLAILIFLTLHCRNSYVQQKGLKSQIHAVDMFIESIMNAQLTHINTDFFFG